MTSFHTLNYLGSYLYSCFLLSLLSGPSWSWSSDSHARKLKAEPGQRCTVGTTIPAMLGQRSKYCMALSRPCLRTIDSSARSAGATCGCAWVPCGGRRRRSRLSSSPVPSDWEPSEPTSARRLSAQARCSRRPCCRCSSRAESARSTMVALTQVARVCRLRQLRRRSQSAVKSCCSEESSSGSHCTRSSSGSTLLIPRRPTEVCSPSTACRHNQRNTVTETLTCFCIHLETLIF